MNVLYTYNITVRSQQEFTIFELLYMLTSINMNDILKNIDYTVLRIKIKFFIIIFIIIKNNNYLLSMYYIENSQYIAKSL